MLMKIFLSLIPTLPPSPLFPPLLFILLLGIRPNSLNICQTINLPLVYILSPNEGN